MKSAALLTAFLLAGEILAAGAARPNLVVILADDQGWGDLSVQGNRNLQTPHIDSLARTGVRFDRFYVCPVCSPTRAEFFTGRYHPRGGVRGVSTGGERLDLDEQTIAQVFKQAGYVTGAFGKWHNGSQFPYHPNARGFDEFYGFTSGHWGTYFDPPLEHNGKPVRAKGYITDVLTDRAMEFIRKNRSRSFFCYLPLNTPHSPMQVPERFFTRFVSSELPSRGKDPSREDLEFTRAALAMCENIDWNVGRLLKELDDLRLAENTMVVYFSDNGPNSARWNGDMKGQKGSVDEGGVRVPCFIRWPGTLPAGRHHPQISGAIDLLPTLTDLAGIRFVPAKPLDGISLKPLLLPNAPVSWPDRLIFSHWNKRVSVRSQSFRLDNDQKLFHFPTDPGQQTNVARQFPEVFARLSSAQSEWRITVLAELPNGPERPFTVGYREFPRTELPARDGVPHGTIRRSASAPNCSFFTQWSDPSDSITWNLDVATAGSYEVEILYACAPQNVGVLLEATSGESRLGARVRQAHNPSLQGAENDRVSRKGESYVKDWKRLVLGKMELAEGEQSFTLRAKEIPGREAIELRSLVLTLRRSR